MPTSDASRHCLVTGANRGLGLEFTRQLLARGARVVATCRQPGRAHALNRLAAEYPGHLHVLPLDVADARSRAALVAELPLIAERIDLLLNNAGVLHSGERFGQLTPANLDDSLHVNATGPLLLSQALAPILADAGRIANVSSQLGSIAGTSAFRTPSYAISKAAQNMATALLAAALGERGIIVLALHPGWVRTDMGGAGAEVAPAAAAAALLDVIDAATTDDSGGFFDRHGQPLPW